MESNSLWTRRSNSGKLSLSMSSSAHSNSNNNTTGDAPSSKIFGPPSAKLTSSHKPSYENPFAKLHNINTGNPALPSPTANATKSASAAFNLGIGGAFGSFGLKTPKTPSGDGLNATGSVSTGAIATPSLPKGLTASEVVAGTKKSNNNAAAVNQQDAHPLKNVWVVWYRSPGNKFQDYEKSTQKIAYFGTVEEFWCVYGHLRRPNVLPHVSDYHLFKKGIRPVWEDKENRRGGKWNIRLKKGVSTRYWEELLLAIVGDQFGDAGEDLCGAVLSIRGNEDVLSVWTRVDGSSCLKIKETVKRKLNLPQGTRIEWKSHASSLEAVNQKSQGQNQNQGQNQGQVQPQ